jgi:transposase
VADDAKPDRIFYRLGFEVLVNFRIRESPRPPDGGTARKTIRRAIRSPEAKLFFLPKYSPDLNPIEQVFAKLKHLLRKTAARTLEAVIAAIGQLLRTYTTQQCANYFKKRRLWTNLEPSSRTGGGCVPGGAYFVMPYKLPGLKSKFGTYPPGPWTRPPKDDNFERPPRILVPNAALLRSFDDCLGQGERHV